MEPALRAVCKDVRIGKILIQTNLDSGEPEVEKINHFVSNVLLIVVLRMIMFATFSNSPHCSILFKNQTKAEHVLIVSLFFYNSST